MASPVIATQSSVSDVANTTSRAVTAPSGIADNDWLLHLSMVDGGSSVTPPSGFTTIWESAVSSANAILHISAKLAASESGSYTIGTASEIGHHLILRITGSTATTVAAFVNTLSHAIGDNDDTHMPSLPGYANAADTLVLRMAGVDGGIAVTDPAGQTSVFAGTATSTGTGFNVCSANQASAGYSAPALFTSAGEQYIAVTLILNSTTVTSNPAQPVIRSMCWCQPSSTVALLYPKPYGTVDGDTLLLNQTSDVTTILTNPGSAFTSAQDTSNTAIWAHVLWRIASSEGASYTGSNTTAAAKYGMLMRITGAHATTPINTSSVATGTSNAPAAATITPSVDNCLIFTSESNDQNKVTVDSGFPSGYNEIFALGTPTGSDVGMIAAYLPQTTAGATGSLVYALTASVAWIAMNVALAPPAVAGIAFDAAGNSGDQAAASSYSGSASWSGSNRILCVDVSMLGPGVTVTAMTYGGAACTLVGAQSTVTSFGRVEQWRIISSDAGAPGTGSNTLAVTLSGSLEFSVEWVSYNGVHQNSPTEAFNSAQATNVGVATDASVAVTSVADNCWIHAAVVANDTSISAGNTTRNNISGTLGSGANEDNGAAKTPAGSVTMSYSGMGITTTWAIAGYAIRPVAASSVNTVVAAQVLNLGFFNRFGIQVS